MQSGMCNRCFSVRRNKSAGNTFSKRHEAPSLESRMESDITYALESQPARSAPLWRGMVNRYWNMDCSFDRVDPARLKGTCWRMGKLEFAVADVSAQQWISLAGPGWENWRNETIVAFM